MSNLLERCLVALCCWAAARLRQRVVRTHDGDPLWSRYRLGKLGRHTLYLNLLHRSDEDEELHSHPWTHVYTLVLTGGYIEERRLEHSLTDDVVTRKRRPFSLDRLHHYTMHRIELPWGACWTLTLVGPATHSWGFWDRHTGEYIPWRRFAARKQAPRGDGGFRC